MALLAVLFIVSHLIYHRYFRFITPVAESGSVVMALGIFAITCLPQFHFSPFLMLAAALELFIIWLYIIVRLMQAYLRDTLSLQSFSSHFYIGTWVAASVIVVLFVDQVQSTLHGFIVFLGMMAILIYIIYLILIARFMRICIRKRFRVPVNGAVMLTVIATQAIVLLFSELFGGIIPFYFYQALILLGAFFYLGGLALIIRYTLVARRHSFMAVWPNANHIIYGAIAITGLAMLKSHAFHEAMLMPVWQLASLFVFLMILMDVVRLVMRIRTKGIRKAIFVYHTSQWARVFTVAMYYTFTFDYYNREYPVNVLVKMIARYGHYPVTLLLVFELMIVLSFVIHVNRNPRENAR